MSKEKDLLLFIAVLPGDEIREEVTNFKKYALERFQSGRALKSPPHITLIPPFRWSPGRIEELKMALKYYAKSCSSFSLTLHGFNCFEPRVIFVDIEKDEELERLQSTLQDLLHSAFSIQNDCAYGFNPHMTVAFKDLRKSVFPLAWKYFSNLDYMRVFKVKQLYLLQHDGRQWQIVDDFKFEVIS